MNEKKVCFISCVNNQELYREALYYISQLEVPSGYEVECISVENAQSMTQGYNKAMQSSDAKYKVYLHQDTYIRNRNFIYDIISTFNKSEKIGMLAVAGAKRIPTNGIWWEAKEKFGKVYDSHTGKMELLSFSEVVNDYEPVQAVDGLIMITQYDIPWREDIFDGWHFYDISQSVEFIRAGYNVVIPKQDEPWIIHDCGLVNVSNGYEYYRKAFLNEYSKDIFPLVSILIPAYNQTKYLKEALESAINQTYPNIEIIIGDDSTNDEVKKFLQPYLEKYKHITYFKNERTEMDYGYKNYVECFRRSKGEYINYLNHDDIFHIKKIEHMMQGFLENPNVTLVTSVRQPIDEFGNQLPITGAFQKLFDNDSLIGGHQICRHVVMNLVNLIGEPTTVLFKRRYIEEGKYGYFNGMLYWGIADVANWFTLLEYGDMIYLTEPLSYFRFHSEQSANMSKVFIKGSIAWYYLARSSYEKGLINLNEYKATLNNWIKQIAVPLNQYLINNDVETELKDEAAKAYNEAVDVIIYKKQVDNCECPVCGSKMERFLPYQYREHFSDYATKFNIIGSDTENFLCPYCSAHDRMRHLVKYFEKLNIWDKYIINKRILHMAPEQHMQQIISKLNTEQYICGDLYPINDSIIKMNITDLPFENNYFDFIICNHVLEHITDDLKAMSELYRVLKHGGFAVLQTPYSPIIEKSFEDETIVSEDDRRKYYGQADHVRVYGNDFFDRLKAVGFQLKIVKNNDIFTKEESKKYGFNSREDLILVSK
jgi:glycosyltransferase involved in cell wall biosynthesis/SAM-dependent methyltransferase